MDSKKLTVCIHCGHKVSVLATACPGCGGPLEPIKEKPFWDVSIGPLFVILFSFTMFFAVFCSETETSKSPPPPLTKQDKIEKQFSQWDGSHLKLAAKIKLSMNDPDSYSHVSTTYIDKGTYLIVKTKFRGKNAFGGIVLQTMKAKVAIEDGSVLQILE